MCSHLTWRPHCILSFNLHTHRALSQTGILAGGCARASVFTLGIAAALPSLLNLYNIRPHSFTLTLSQTGILVRGQWQ